MWVLNQKVRVACTTACPNLPQQFFEFLLAMHLFPRLLLTLFTRSFLCYSSRGCRPARSQTPAATPRAARWR